MKSCLEKNNKVTKYSKSTNNINNKLVGGTKKECEILNKSIGHIVEHLPNVSGLNMEKLLYENIIKSIEQYPFKVDPSLYKNNFDGLQKAVYDNLKDNHHRQEGFLDQMMRYSRLMTKQDQPFPIDFYELSYTQFCYHMKWYQDNYYDKTTGKNWYGLKHRKDCVNCYLTAYGIPKQFLWTYPLPPEPNRKSKYIMDPITAHEIINYNFYLDNPDRTINLQYIHAFNNWVGPRAPNEIASMKTSYIDWNQLNLDVLEQKVHYSIRTVFDIEPIIFLGKTRKSLKNYIDKIRPKFENQYSKDYLFINTEGKPWNVRHLGNELGKTGRMVDPKYHAYSGRHFCCSARLIQAWINKDPDPLDYVQNFVGHDEQATTEGYVRQTRSMYRKYPFDWISYTLKRFKIRSGDSVFKSKQKEKTFVSNGKTDRIKSGPVEI